MISGRLIKKYNLSKEDQDDIKSEIALSDLEYGYQRNHEYVVIDYLSKARGYKRTGPNGKRECAFKSEEYSETFNQSTKNRELATSGRIAFDRHNENDDRELELDRVHQLETLQFVLGSMPEKKAKIFTKHLAGESLKEIGIEIGVSESRISQILTSLIEKTNLLMTLNISKISGVVRW